MKVSYPFFVDVGYGNTFNADNILGVIRTGTRGADRALDWAKKNRKVWDCRMSKTLNSIFLLTNGDVVLSHLSLETARKRLNSGIRLSADPKEQDDECRYTEVIIPDTPMVFQKNDVAVGSEDEDIFDDVLIDEEEEGEPLDD